MAFDHNSQVDAIGDAFKCVEVVILRHYRQMLRSRNRAFGTISRVAAPGLEIGRQCRECNPPSPDKAAAGIRRR